MTMDSEVILTRGVMRDIGSMEVSACRAKYPHFDVQVLQVKEITNQSGPRRFRFVLSDGECFVQCMIAMQLNELAISKEVDRGSIIRVKEFSPSYMKEKLVVIVVDFEVLKQYGLREKIGAPVSLDSVPGKQAARPATAPYSAAGVGSGTTFYGNQTAAPAVKSDSNYSATSAPAVETKPRPANLYTIEALSPYQNKWTIKARVTFKSEIKRWHNQRGEGKLFAVHLLDETGEIKATAFNEQADQYFDVLQEGEVYYISKCRVNTAKKQFSNLSNEYELVIERDTEIEKCADSGNADIPAFKFNFLESLDKLSDFSKDAVVDVIGVIKSVGECSQMTSKSTGRPFDKRELVIVDKSATAVQLTIWGNQAINFTGRADDVVAVKGAKVSEFNGRSLSLMQSATLTLNPDIDDAHALKGWFDTAGRNATFSSLQATGSMVGRDQNMKTIAQIREEQLGSREEPDYFSVKGTILFFRPDNFAYPACPTENCNKKLVDESDVWRCEKCEKVFSEPVYRYVTSFSIYDHTGQLWLSAFDAVGQVVLGRTAGEFMKMRDEQSSMVADEFTKQTGKTYIFRVRGKQETYQQTTRPRFSALTATPLDYASESKNLISLINSFDI